MLKKIKHILISFTLGIALAGLITGAANAAKPPKLPAADCPYGQHLITTKYSGSGQKIQEYICNNPPTNTNPIWGDLKDLVNALAGGVGVVVIAVIIVGGIQYTTAGDQASKVEEAKKRIANALVALIAFFLTWALLQWLIPTGIFHP